MTGGRTEALLCVCVALRHHGQHDWRRCACGGGCQSVTEAEDDDDDDNDDDINIVESRDATVDAAP